jgi:hypothetical protein
MFFFPTNPQFFSRAHGKGFLGVLGVSAVNQFDAYCMKAEARMKSLHLRHWLRA